MFCGANVNSAEQSHKSKGWVNVVAKQSGLSRRSPRSGGTSDEISPALIAWNGPAERLPGKRSESNGLDAKSGFQIAQNVGGDKRSYKAEERPHKRTTDWLSRVRFNFNYETNSDPTLSVSTIQPLYQSEGNKNTLFTQLRYAHHQQFDESRNTTNIGFGYRRLLGNGDVLVGANVHYDREWKRSHSRLGFGVEARWSGADIYINRYQGLSGRRTISATITEEIVNGWDMQALVQMPYIPSARFSFVGSSFRKNSNEYVSGLRAGVEADLSPQWTMEFGAANDNDEDDIELFFGLRFSLAGRRDNTNVLLKKNFVSDSIWYERAMAQHTLDRVRRENNIRLKRTTSSPTGSVSVEVERS